MGELAGVAEVAMTMVMMPALIASASLSQAARMALDRRESDFPRVRVKNHATFIVANGKAPARAVCPDGSGSAEISST